MKPGTFSDPIFRDPEKARAWLERELWPAGPVCPHCGTVDEATYVEGEKHTHRDGLYMCNACRKQFTVTVGTLFERSHIPLNKWLFALFLLMSSKKGVSAHQMHRMIGVSYKSTWFMMMRLREALREGFFTEPLGGEGKTIEIDEAFIGGLEKFKHRNKRKHAGTGGQGKEAVFALVERGGSVRSHHVPVVNAKTLGPILREQMKEGSKLMSDESVTAMHLGAEFGNHQAVNHSIGEYVRGDAHTNTVEGYFAILKRGVHGVYHHVSPAHLKRYLAEFDYRYNERSKLGVTDEARTAKAVKGIVGKRLTYRRTGSPKPALPLA
jgi:transposase-like protein